MIKEVIIVEGKDDISAVKRSVDADLIATSGFGITSEIMEKIKNASKMRGIIIFTDPDSSGEKIRKILASKVPNCKHAFLPRDEAVKDGDIGIENASPESIREALKKVKTEVYVSRTEFKIMDLVRNGLAECGNASKMRDKLGKILGIGYGNAKQILSRLNRYGITRNEFNEALEKIKEC